MTAKSTSWSITEQQKYTLNQACKSKANCSAISPKTQTLVLFLNALSIVCNVQTIKGTNALYLLSFNFLFKFLHIALFMFGPSDDTLNSLSHGMSLSITSVSMPERSAGLALPKQEIPDIL